MSEAKEYMCFDEYVVNIMLEILGVAMRDNFPNSRVDRDDMGYMFDALTVLCVRTPELEMFEGLLNISRNDYISASHVFQNLVDTGRCMPASRAMLALCKSMNNDPNWRREADQLLEENADDNAVLMMRTIIAKQELFNAIEQSKRTGNFEVPESLAALKNERAKRQVAHAEIAVPVPTQIDPSMMMNGQYMRL